MLGNFSFGDYFKLEVIVFVWEFFIKIFNLLLNCLVVSVFWEDDEVFVIWCD